MGRDESISFDFFSFFIDKDRIKAIKIEMGSRMSKQQPKVCEVIELTHEADEEPQQQLIEPLQVTRLYCTVCLSA